MMISPKSYIDEQKKKSYKELLKETLPEYLEVLNNEKAITARQCIQSLGIIAAAKPEYGEMIAESLMKIDLSSARETMRKSILADIVITLLTVRKSSAAKQIDKYIENALSGSLLDKKTKKDIEKLLN